MLLFRSLTSLAFLCVLGGFRGVFCVEEIPQKSSRIQVNGRVGKNVKVHGSIGTNIQINGIVGDNVQFLGNIGNNVQINGKVGNDVKFGGNLDDKFQLNGSIGKGAHLMGKLGEGAQINGSIHEDVVLKTAMGAGSQINGSFGKGSVISGNLLAPNAQFNGSVADGLEYMDSLPEKHQFYGQVRGLPDMKGKALGSAATVLVVTNVPYPSMHLVLHVPVKDKEKYSKGSFWDAIKTPQFKVSDGGVKFGTNVHFYKPVKGSCEFKAAVGDDVIFDVEIPDGHVFTKAIPSRSRVVSLDGKTEAIDYQPGTKNLPSNSAISAFAVKSLGWVLAAGAALLIIV